ncbi:MAG: hypothetical protein IJI58_04790 [Bacilli bacterium]|nr:hypothetical protein [Bacilli bacterium]
MSEAVSTSYTSIENQITECRRLINEFIESARNMQKTKDSLMNTYKGQAASVYSNKIDEVSGDQQKQQQAILDTLEVSLRSWSEKTKESESRTISSTQTIS